MTARALEAPDGGSHGASCRSFDGMIARLGTPAISPEDEARVRAHLADCPRCNDVARLLDATQTAPPETTPPEAPAMLSGRYRLDRRLAGGGMGVVWAATDVERGGPVAVKLLRSAGPRQERRLLREARAASAVRHPNVVRILDVVEHEGSPALVMELLAGATLQGVFDAGPVPLAELALVVEQVAAALQAVHEAGIVHRDLKPDNVFLARDEEGVCVKLLDFGIAKRTTLDRHASGTLTRTGALMGTPFYMSPEQALGEADVDARADLWGLGLLLHQGLSGDLPTRADNLGQVIKLIALMPFEPLERLVPGVPGEVAALAQRLLDKDRAARPGLDEVRDVLGRHAGGSLEALLARCAPAGAPTQGNPAGARLIRAPAKRRRLGVLAAAGVVVAAGLGLAAAGAREGASPVTWLAAGAEGSHAPDAHEQPGPPVTNVTPRPLALTLPATSASAGVTPPVLPVAPSASASAQARASNRGRRAPLARPAAATTASPAELAGSASPIPARPVGIEVEREF